MSKVAIVWGAGGGIGRALVYRLREEGWRVLGAYRDGQRGVLEF